MKLDGADVYSQANGHAILNKCQWIQHGVSDDASKPVFEVCGTSTQVTVYLRGECEEYYKYNEKVGVCNSNGGCQTLSTGGWTWPSARRSATS